MNLNVLLVEDDSGDLKSYRRDFPDVFKAAGIEATIHPAKTFAMAYKLIDQSHVRFDLILSDTFRGNRRNRDAAVIAMVNKYRGGRFCPLIVFSASAKPDNLEVGAFVMWADKSVKGDIESAIKKMLATGIPQLARRLHDELDQTAGGFLWQFLEINWDKLWPGGTPDVAVLERLVRRRAALQLSEIGGNGGTVEPVTSIAGLEYYTYPPLHSGKFRLGHIIKNKASAADIRVVITPHCHLTIQQQQTEPRAKHVLTVKTTNANAVLGSEKISNAKALVDETKRDKKLKIWATPPSGEPVGLPEGRFWFLPAFLEIPHSYVDFQQMESLPYSDLVANFTPLATLTPPFAESLQSCFLAYYAGVGIPNIRPESIRSLLA
jgi:hypothetical protein